MAEKNIKSRNGFTIIEVVLVLAIAGLIFLMVFIALPALQRSQRDTQRRDDLARVATALTQFQTNNGGNLPADANISAANAAKINPSKGTYDGSAWKAGGAPSFIGQYLNGTSDKENSFKDPDGTTYGLNISTAAKSEKFAPTTFNHVIYIKKRANCQGEQSTYTGVARDYAILYKLEGSGTYCADNK